MYSRNKQMNCCLELFKGVSLVWNCCLELLKCVQAIIDLEKHHLLVQTKIKISSFCCCGYVWYCYCIHMFDKKKLIYFELLRGQGCVESKNMTSAKRKSTMSSLNPSIIQVASFKYRADVLLWHQDYESIKMRKLVK